MPEIYGACLEFGLEGIYLEILSLSVLKLIYNLKCFFFDLTNSDK